MNKFFTIWSAWFFATMFYTYQCILRVLPNVSMKNIIHDFDINATQIGVFSGVYYIGYTLMHIPIGLLIDRFSVKKILPLCVFLTSLGLVPLIYSDLFTNAILGRLLLGAASSAAVLGLFKVIKVGFGEEKFTSLIGMSVTIGLLGAIYGGRPLDYLISIYGWDKIINIFIIYGIFFSVLLYLVLPNTSKEDRKHRFSIVEMWDDVKIIFCNSKVVLLSFIGGLMVGPIEGFADAWGTSFFESFYGLGRDDATILPSVIFFGMCFGSTLLGYITDKTKSHIKIVVTSNIIMLVSFLFIFSGQCNLYILYILMFIIGFLSAYQLAILSKVREYNDQRLADLTSAAGNMIMMIFGTIFHVLIGVVTSHFDSVTKGLVVIPVALILALILLFTLMAKKFFTIANPEQTS